MRSAALPSGWPIRAGAPWPRVAGSRPRAPFERALALWRGPVLADLAGEPFHADGQCRARGAPGPGRRALGGGAAAHRARRAPHAGDRGAGGSPPGPALAGTRQRTAPVGTGSPGASGGGARGVRGDPACAGGRARHRSRAGPGRHARARAPAGPGLLDAGARARRRKRGRAAGCGSTRSSAGSATWTRSRRCWRRPGWSRSPVPAAPGSPAWPRRSPSASDGAPATAPSWWSWLRSTTTASCRGRSHHGWASRPPSRWTVSARLGDRPFLFVLDNLEHLPGIGATVAALLRGTTGIRVLATSARPSVVPGEQQYAVPPLDVPPAESTPSWSRPRRPSAAGRPCPRRAIPISASRRQRGDAGPDRPDARRPAARARDRGAVVAPADARRRPCRAGIRGLDIAGRRDRRGPAPDPAGHHRRGVPTASRRATRTCWPACRCCAGAGTSTPSPHRGRGAGATGRRRPRGPGRPLPRQPAPPVGRDVPGSGCWRRCAISPPTASGERLHGSGGQIERPTTTPGGRSGWPGTARDPTPPPGWSRPSPTPTTCARRSTTWRRRTRRRNISSWWSTRWRCGSRPGTRPRASDGSARPRAGARVADPGDRPGLPGLARRDARPLGGSRSGPAGGGPRSAAGDRPVLAFALQTLGETLDDLDGACAPAPRQGGSPTARPRSAPAPPCAYAGRRRGQAVASGAAHNLAALWTHAPADGDRWQRRR